MAVGDEAKAYLSRKSAGMYAILDNHARRMEGQAKSTASWTDRTSTARRALHAGVDVRVPNELFSLYLAHGVEYGGILEEGSPPHVIRPKNKKALYWPGAKHPVKKVNHPGTRGYPVVKPTVEGNLSRIRMNIRDYWRNT